MIRQLLWSAFLAAMCVAACERRPDTGEHVRKALGEARIDQVEVKVDDQANIVHLRGNVASMEERTRAQAVADAVVGTTGRVLNETTVKGLNEEDAGDLDRQIESALDRMIDRDSLLKQRDINFDVLNGMVTIKGEVRNADEKSRVGDLAKVAPGVKDIANGLAIHPEQ